jgi:prepilin-type processing-associated H-X9-DG protein/prepilin-type N-terminal cleavage/methylation domain-containing protein
MAPSQGRSRLRGFTLIELLTVVAVLAVLVSMLLPAMKRARAAARSAQCTSQLRQIGVAFAAYMANNDGHIGTQARQEDYDLYPWYTFYNGTLKSQKNRVYAAGVIGKRDDSIYRCPEMDPATAHAGSAWIVSVYGLVSPAKNDPAEMTTAWTVNIGGTNYTNSMTSIRVPVIKRPGRYVLVFDTSAMADYRYRLGATHWSPEGLGPIGNGAWAYQQGGIWLAHGGRANGLFADGHVESWGKGDFRQASNPTRYTSTKMGIQQWKNEFGRAEPAIRDTW